MRKSVFSPYKIFSVFHLPPARSLVFLFCFLLLVSCASYKLEKNLDPESRAFLSKVRFIITKQERKIFLSLAPSERENFIEEFWKKRDPDPDTEENEFKEQYFNRIEEANRLFRDEGPQGWLQDRGRIYILLGPPDNREVYPKGYTFYGKPTEIWYYGFFPIVFIDQTWNGNYKLEPLSARHISEINKAQMELKPKVKAKEVVFDFNLRVKKVKEDEMLIQIEVPYKNIWFAEKENNLETILELSVEIFDSFEKKVWKHQKTYPISLTKENLEEIIGKSYSIEIPVRLVHGNYTLTAELENITDESRVMKKIKFTI
jgi:GWxTD domain-containing protein